MRPNLVTALYHAYGPPLSKPIPLRRHQSSSSPPQWPNSSHPTPYDILSAPRNETYCKARFCQLVKLYHPDSQNLSSLPSAIRLERYRLVVAANDILADPTKRRLYDEHGIGWVHGRRSGGAVDEDWRRRPGSAAGNATWEDWHAWHEARRRRDADPSAAQHETGNVKVSTVLIHFVIIFTAFKLLVPESSSAKRLRLAEQQTAAIGDEIRRTTEATAGRSMDERVHQFLRYRQDDEKLRHRRNANHRVSTPSTDVVKPSNRST
ncbi:Hsp40 co-chaperone Jid1 [Ophiocordyceps camponoti-floridani]|uniref:Hsp40 co-chaperone Jid1 n=1 Tax=Ophiocordyceps camponoti-floridani TaxID=2030778 RepID=A0A8H4Q592_9HYPO|nr:Hsp40 co-chaperone Jid1 [Ophiocordyceps camponoti-floridani]